MARGLILWADGVRAVFQAGAIDGLAAAGPPEWVTVWGVGTGAANGLLVAGGGLQGMSRLWLAEAEAGFPALRPKLARATEVLDALSSGLVAAADPAALDGLHDATGLREILEPFAAAATASTDGPTLLVSVACLQTGEVLSLNPATDVEPERAADLVLAACSRPPLLEPVRLTVVRPGLACSGRDCQFVTGAVGVPSPVEDVCAAAAARLGTTLEGVDIILASPDPAEPARHTWHGLADLVARGDDIAAHRILGRPPHTDHGSGVAVRLIRPTTESWREFTDRPDADLLLEFPGATDRNRELLSRVHGYGRWLAGRAGRHLPARSTP